MIVTIAYVYNYIIFCIFNKSSQQLDAVVCGLSNNYCVMECSIFNVSWT